ncbi:LTA synthase family protein [Ruminiclostridium papyrosolvens]|uniref:Sulfatase n=1 Tax=Ruminiclostridium papyrosolvens C7 TaxID=1330534 RepID=U4R321_9FIRM|nr:sulfatase-like hydrolase/transferase [Ruminiclostridium papyrosolvens]EPR12845.1 sulfatase [Ruminiclostridium papyrosolvens C7]
MVNLFSAKSQKRIELGYIWTFILVAVFTIALTITGFLLQPNDFHTIATNVLKHPSLFILNGFPVLAGILFFYLVFNNVFFSVSLVSIVFHVVSLINRFKIIFRDDPFVPQDVFLGAEAANIMSDTKMKLDITLISLVLIFSLAMLVLGVFIKFKKIKVPIKIAGCVAIVGIAILSNTFVYSSREIYDRMPSKSKANVAAVFNDVGFNYCFLYNMSAYKMEVPENYSKSAAEKLVKKYTKSKATPKVKANVIIVMNEAFSDISLDKAFKFSPEDDPLKNFKVIGKEKNSVSGHLVVPNFGGGTANTEFDVMTGMQTLNLNTVPTSSFRLIHRNIKSIAGVFGSDSYEKYFMHPGDSWFYNRANVYRFLGVENQTFIDQFKKPQDLKGSLISDKAAGEKIISLYEKNTDSGKNPVFNYNVTIQNHMPYTSNKYNGLKVKEVPTDKQLSPQAKTLLSNYFEGVRDEDKLLKTLTDYFRKRQEPVILVFFGDHKPSLGDSYLAYKEAGIDINESGTIEQAMMSREVPYIIWANDSAGNSLDFASSAGNLGLPEDNTISANYLGAIVLQLMGYDGYDPYFDFLNELRKELPVITRYNFKTKNGYTDKLTEKQQALVQDLRIWQYYRMTSDKAN